MNDAGLSGQRFRNAEPGTEREKEHENGAQDAQMASRLVADDEPAIWREHDAAADEVRETRCQTGEQHGREGQVVEEVKKRELEEIEGDVVSQDGGRPD
ncbi:MAG: hypothetical protein WDO56_11225 [Gammaproteobacteria bacterium]